MQFDRASTEEVLPCIGVLGQSHRAVSHGNLSNLSEYQQIYNTTALFKSCSLSTNHPKRPGVKPVKTNVQILNEEPLHLRIGGLW